MEFHLPEYEFDEFREIVIRLEVTDINWIGK